MELENIMIVDCKQSATNIKGRCEGKGFDELVASVKANGILMPVLARALSGKNKIGKWEIIAGNRRLVAAKEAGLEKIPAQIVEMNDDEAREAQIIENLQRQDIHPLDEGKAYRELIENSKPRLEIKAVAARVGKSETYIRQRLLLTNLEVKPAEEFRKGKINDGHAVLIAGLSAGDQAQAMKFMDESVTISELKDWIDDNINSCLDNQPWIENKEMEKVVGPCKECEPNRLSLFGPNKEGACTEKKCWQRKMTKYIERMVKDKQLIKITDSYHSSEKSVLGKGDYSLVSRKEPCDSAVEAIYNDGYDIGKISMICADKKCPKHSEQKSDYKLTDEEKAERKKEAKKAKIRNEKNQIEFQEAIKKVKWPMNEKQLNALFDFALYRCGGSYQQPAAKLLGIEIVRKEETRGWETKKKVMVIDYNASFRKFAIGPVEKLKAIFALLIPHPSNYGDNEFNKAVKKL